MDSFLNVINFIIAHPGEIAVCVGFPVALHLLAGGRGGGGDWFGGDGDCGGDGGD